MPLEAHISTVNSERWLVSTSWSSNRGERNFWMQRLEAKNPPERPLFTAETRNAQNRQQDPRRNGLFSIADGYYRSGRLDGGDYLDQTACSPRRDRTSLRHSSQERNFLLQRRDGKMGSFAAIAGAETALTKEIDRHVFEIAELLRVSLRLYNLRVWVVGTTGIEPVTPTMSR